MPMFYTPKPRQFHYTPRLYDPEKEEWEKLKTKYRLEKGLPLSDDAVAKSQESNTSSADLEYFKRKVKDLDREEREKKSKLTLMDLFRKREKPQFHYVSRFDADGNLIENPQVETATTNTPQRRIKRRFEDEDMERFKPIPASKIILYTLAVCLLLLFILK